MAARETWSRKLGLEGAMSDDLGEPLPEGG